MNKLTTATAALLVTVLTAPAHAADLPPAPSYKAPVMVPTYNWTGFYVGANVGGGFANFTNVATAAGVTFTGTTKLNGVIGGGQIGYNWQYTNFVFGLEADFQGSSQRLTTTTVTGRTIINETDKFPWFGTVRGRVGVTPVDRWLVYATGGLAYGEVQTSGNVTVGAAASTFNASSTKAGWTVGGGVEAALWDNWTAKVEYLYVDINNFTLNTAVFATPITTTLHLKENIGRVGVNYRFSVGP
jgi:outer membrane immunogenic protein